MSLKLVFNPFTSKFDWVHKDLSGVARLYNLTGINLSGDDGDMNRQYTALRVPILIVVDNQTLNKNYDYTLSGKTITFLHQIFNSQRIDIIG